jgi:putative membrane protein
MNELSIFPPLNASLNALTGLLLLIGFVLIKRGHKIAHRAVMSAAFINSSIFLACYLYYHFHYPMNPYPLYDWTRPVYFTVLITHVILAIVVLPFILLALYRAIRGEFEKHKRLTRWVWPVWMYVSVTGVLIYFMLYQWSR